MIITIVVNTWLSNAASSSGCQCTFRPVATEIFSHSRQITDAQLHATPRAHRVPLQSLCMATQLLQSCRFHPNSSKAMLFPQRNQSDSCRFHQISIPSNLVQHNEIQIPIASNSDSIKFRFNSDSTQPRNALPWHSVRLHFALASMPHSH